MERLHRLLTNWRSHAWWRRTRWVLVHGAILLGSLLVLMLVLAGAAGWYTSRPQFCASCHIMEPYYTSWQKSKHKDVSCIECHFPPGFGGKVRGKMLGLVQLAKYVTASAGPRPAAEIPDASCLRSGCHETRLLAGRVSYVPDPKNPTRVIAFNHTPHLGEMRRGKQLRCTSCHSQIVQGEHMTVTASTCFLCHFKGQPFNEGLGACTKCHQIPEEDFDLGGDVKFNHDMVFKKLIAHPGERIVDCADCHGDLIRGTGEVPPERCLSCHNREGDLAKIGDHDFMHAKHVTEHKVDCLQCHLKIRHSLDKEKMVHAAGDCQSCHPNHHAEQVQMLQGKGAETVKARSTGMLAFRVECRTCHRVKQVSATGTVQWKASTEMCKLCHEDATVKQFESYHVQLRAAVRELQATLARAREKLPAASLGEDRLRAVTARLGQLQHDLDFLHTANDVHNMHYAAKVAQGLVEGAAAVCRELKVEGPKVSLPAMKAGTK